MLVSAAASEICSRAGEGFSQHSARAKVLFWRSIGELVQKGEVKTDELRTLKAVAFVTKDANGTAPVEVDITAASPNGFATEIAGNYLFDVDYVVVDATMPQTTLASKIFCSRVSESLFENAEHLANLSTLRKEVIYSVKYPKVRMLKNALITTTASVKVEMRYYGLAKTTADADATELNNYFDTATQDKAIAYAAELLKTEII